MSCEPAIRRAVTPPARRWPSPISARLRRTSRFRWHRSPEEARDSAQEFFRSVVERELLERYDARRPASGPISGFAWTRSSGMRALRSTARSAAAAKHRSSSEFVDRSHLEGEPSPDALFEREWRRSIFSLAVERTRAQLLSTGKNEHWAVLEGFDSSDGSTAIAPRTRSWPDGWDSRSPTSPTASPTPDASCESGPWRSFAS